MILLILPSNYLKLQLNFQISIPVIAIIPYPMVAYFQMKTDGSRHRNVDDIFDRTINTSQHLLIPFFPIARSADQVTTSRSIARSCSAGVR